MKLKFNATYIIFILFLFIFQSKSRDDHKLIKQINRTKDSIIGNLQIAGNGNYLLYAQNQTSTQQIAKARQRGSSQLLQQTFSIYKLELDQNPNYIYLQKFIHNVSGKFKQIKISDTGDAFLYRYQYKRLDYVVIQRANLTQQISDKIKMPNIASSCLSPDGNTFFLIMANRVLGKIYSYNTSQQKYTLKQQIKMNYISSFQGKIRNCSFSKNAQVLIIYGEQLLQYRLEKNQYKTELQPSQFIYKIKQYKKLQTNMDFQLSYDGRKMLTIYKYADSVFSIVELYYRHSINNSFYQNKQYNSKKYYFTSLIQVEKSSNFNFIRQAKQKSIIIQTISQEEYYAKPYNNNSIQLSKFNIQKIGSRFQNKYALSINPSKFLVVFNHSTFVFQISYSQSCLNQCISCYSNFSCIECPIGQHGFSCQYSCSSYSKTCLKCDNYKCLCDSSNGYHLNQLNQCVVQCTLPNKTKKQECFINCNLENKATGKYLSRFDCQCILNYQWKFDKKVCSPLCSKLQHSTGAQIDNQCGCVKNFYWNATDLNCWINCSLIKNTLNIGKRDECGCKKEYSRYYNNPWDFCNPTDCLQDPNALPVNPVATQCVCFEGSIWNYQTAKCVLNCSLVQKAIPQFFQPDKCKCLVGLWNNQINKCVTDCNKVPNSLGNQDKVSDTICKCKKGYIWNSTNSKCWINCELDTKSTQKPFLMDKCSCLTGYAWRDDIKKCFGDCQGENHSPDCQCIQGFYLNKTDLKCYINCSSIQKALNLNQTQTSCICVPGYIWDSSGRCLKDCSSDQFSTKETFLMNRCQCLNGYIWNQKSEKCWKDCRSDIFSTKKSFKVNTCQCIEKFVWKSSIQKCWISCQNISFAKQEQYQIHKCQCLQNYSWNLTQSSCWINCNKDKYSLPQIYLQNQCKCAMQNFTWNSDEKKCFLNCEKIEKSTGKNLNQTVCICHESYSWNSKINKCVMDCSIATFSKHQQNQEGQCICLSGYIWVSKQQKCFRNCSLEEYSTRTLYKENQCFCAQNYTWDKKFQKCVLNCANISFSTGISLQIKKCQCIEDYEWNSQKFECWMNCKDNYSLHKLYLQNQCKCIQGYIWNIEKKQCWINCSQVQFAQRNFYQRNQCLCQEDYSWNSLAPLQIMKCWRKCHTNKFSNAYNSCKCQSKYIWNNTQNNCWINCSLIQNSLKAQFKENKCLCEEKFTWNEEQQVCQFNCSQDQNSQFLSEKRLNSSKCICKQKYKWNHTDQSCWIDCSGKQFPNGQVLDQNTCSCHLYFSWNPYTLNCQVNCSNNLANLQSDKGITNQEKKLYQTKQSIIKACKQTSSQSDSFSNNLDQVQKRLQKKLAQNLSIFYVIIIVLAIFNIIFIIFILYKCFRTKIENKKQNNQQEYSIGFKYQQSERSENKSNNEKKQLFNDSQIQFQNQQKSNKIMKKQQLQQQIFEFQEDNKKQKKDLLKSKQK